jgi:histidinol dehydrogenase
MIRRLHAANPDFAERFAELARQGAESAARVRGEVAAILEAVRREGMAALERFTARFDGFTPPHPPLRVSSTELAAAWAELPSDLKDAIALAARRIEAFHRRQLPESFAYEDETGLTLGMRWQPLGAVGLYVPGGKAAYPSSVLMNAIPARLAGVGRIVITVPAPGGDVSPLVLAAAHHVGVEEVWRIGGAQAIGALAFGAGPLAPVDRIVGPGNAYVAEAKRQVAGEVGIDAIAGPSEVVVLAAAGADPRLVAIDLLAQAEHDENAQALLFTDSEDLARRVEDALKAELDTLPRAEIARAALERHGAAVIVARLEDALPLIDRIAPEHLEIIAPEAETLARRVRNAGAIFIGPHCPEALGDYIAGPNHVLPTSGSARFASGLSVFDFLKRTTWLAAPTPRPLTHLARAAIRLAEAEGLEAHARSLRYRTGPSS